MAELVFISLMLACSTAPLSTTSLMKRLSFSSKTRFGLEFQMSAFSVHLRICSSRL